MSFIPVAQHSGWHTLGAQGVSAEGTINEWGKDPESTLLLCGLPDVGTEDDLDTELPSVDTHLENHHRMQQLLTWLVSRSSDPVVEPRHEPAFLSTSAQVRFVSGSHGGPFGFSRTSLRSQRT